MKGDKKGDLEKQEEKEKEEIKLGNLTPMEQDKLLK